MHKISCKSLQLAHMTFSERLGIDDSGSEWKSLSAKESGRKELLSVTKHMTPLNPEEMMSAIVFLINNHFQQCSHSLFPLDSPLIPNYAYTKIYYIYSRELHSGRTNKRNFLIF
jgi:hypothetical protein